MIIIILLGFNLMLIGDFIRSKACNNYDPKSQMYITNITDTVIHGIYADEYSIKHCDMINDRDVSVSQILNVCGGKDGCYDADDYYTYWGKIINNIGLFLFLVFYIQMFFCINPDKQKQDKVCDNV